MTWRTVTLDPLRPRDRGFGCDGAKRGQKLGIVTVVEDQSVVDRHALDSTRGAPPSDASALLQHPNVRAVLDQLVGTGQTCEPRTDDENVG